MLPNAAPQIPSRPETQEPTPAKQQTIYFRLILIGIIVVIALQAYIILSDQPEIIIPRGTTFALYNRGPTSERQTVYFFTITRPSTITGAYFTSSPVLWFLMTQQQYSNYTCCNLPPSFLAGRSVNIIFYPSGYSDTLDYRLSGGVYYLVFMDNYQNATVTITDSIIIVPF